MTVIPVYRYAHRETKQRTVDALASMQISIRGVWDSRHNTSMAWSPRVPNRWWLLSPERVCWRTWMFVLVWRYDRFARSTQALVQALREFQRLGVDCISYQENIDTTTPQGEMLFTVMAARAQCESALISERVKADMARAQAQGKCISRTPITKSMQVRLAELHGQGVSMHQIGIAYGAAWHDVHRLKRGENHAPVGTRARERECFSSL